MNMSICKLYFFKKIRGGALPCLYANYIQAQHVSRELSDACVRFSVPRTRQLQLHICLVIVCYKYRGKRLLHPSTYEGWNTSHPNLWKWIFYPLNFLKQDKSLLKQFWKNHSKSQKNHKMKNQKNEKSNCVGLQISSSMRWTYNMECFSLYFLL
jgi:hypothetical protein